MKVLVVGGSRNIGYYSALRLLQKGATVTFLLRNVKCFDKDESIKSFVSKGSARLVQGDALKEDDVRKAWTVAAEGEGKLDTVLFSLGALPSVSLTKGIYLTPPDICTHSLVNLLKTCPEAQLSDPPRLVIVSSNGIGSQGHSELPCVLKPFYSVVLRNPHADKLGLEHVAAHAAGRNFGLNEKDVPDKKILEPGWEANSGVPQGVFGSMLIVRPALLTDGECKGDKDGEGAYRADEKLSKAYNISRKDVAHFIAEQALQDWNKWEGKSVTVTY